MSDMIPDATSVFDLDPDLHRYTIHMVCTTDVAAETEAEAERLVMWDIDNSDLRLSSGFKVKATRVEVVC